MIVFPNKTGRFVSENILNLRILFVLLKELSTSGKGKTNKQKCKQQSDKYAEKNRHFNFCV